jgi:hypothetical protein
MLVLLCVIGFLFIATTYESSARIGAKYAKKIYYKHESTDYLYEHGDPRREKIVARKEYGSQEIFWFTRVPIINYIFAPYVRYRYLSGAEYHDALNRLYVLDRGEMIEDINKIVEQRRADKLAAWEKELGINQKQIEQQIDSVRTLRSRLTRAKQAC